MERDGNVSDTFSSNPQRTSGSDGGVSKAATIVGDGSATNTSIVEGGGTRITPSVNSKPAPFSSPTSKPVSLKPSITVKGVSVFACQTLIF